MLGWLSAACIVAGVLTAAPLDAAPDPRNEVVPDDTPHHSAIIDNGVVQLGINDQGHLNLGGGPPSSGTGTSVVGLRYLPTGAESTAPGCLCEGWGAADATSGVTGFANISSDGGVHNMSLNGFSSGVDPGGAGFAVSDVNIGGTLNVVHDFHASATPFLYEATVTIENISGGVVAPRYRRVMDWDVEPTAFNELVTIDGTSSNLLFSSNDGFETANPLGGRGGTPGPFTDLGPDDHGALFDFGFDPIGPGESVTFQIYYGAAGNEVDALNAIDFVGANVWSLGQPGTSPAGEPNTFIFAFSVGGGSSERLNVRKRADSGIGEPDGLNGYSILLANPTAGPMSVTSVEDLLPEGFTYVAGSSTLDGVPIGEPNQTFVGSQRRLQWPGPFTVAPMTTRTLHFGVRLPSDAAGIYYNNATAAALNAGGAAVAVRPTGDAAPIEVPPPDVTPGAPTLTSDTGTTTPDPHTGVPEVTMPWGGRTPITVSTGALCPDGSTPTSVTLEHNGHSYPMTNAGGTWTATIPAADVGEGPVVVVVECGGADLENTIAVIDLYDPSGIVTDAVTGLPIEGATVTLYKVPFALPDSAGDTNDCRTTLTRTGSNWDATPTATLADGILADPTLSPAEIDPLVNPMLTNTDGRYGWLVATGCWFVTVAKTGYVTKVSALVGVPPEVTDLHIALTPTSTPPVTTGGTCNGLAATITGSGSIFGTSGADVIVGSSGPDTISGLGGNDVICGAGGDDSLNGGPGTDYVSGGQGADTIDGGKHADELSGGAGNDSVFGGDGNDRVLGGDGDDLLRGGRGSDFLSGGLGNDRIQGGGGTDAETGKAGDDTMFGGDGDDLLVGSIGDDVLNGGAGTDTCKPGSGANTVTAC